MKKPLKLICIIQLCAFLLIISGAPVLAAVPVAPSNLRLSNYAATTVTIAWNDNSRDETAYHVNRMLAGKTEVDASFTLGISVTRYTDTTASPSTAYTYQVYASNAEGDSALSNTVAVTTRPSPPVPASDLMAMPMSPNTVVLMWTPNAANATGQAVMRKGPLDSTFISLGNLTAATESYTDKTAAASTAYSYKIAVTGTDTFTYNSNESKATTPPPGTVVGPPVAPGDLQLDGEASPFEVDLLWTDNASNEMTYRVERAGADGVYQSLASGGRDMDSYADEAVEQGETYTYRVWCWNINGASGYSNEVSVTVPRAIPPAAPTSLRLNTASSTRVDMSWIDNGTTETTYYIERKGPGDKEFLVLSDGKANLSSYGDSKVTAGSEYKYRVFCSNQYGDSEYSNEISVTIPAVGTPPVYASTVVSYYLNSTTSYVNGTARTMDTAPMVIDDRMLLPIRFVVEPLGGNAVWNGIEQSATVYFNNHTIVLWLDNNTARVDGVETMIDPDNEDVTPVSVPPDRIMLPLRFIAESTGCDAKWYPDTNEARITYIPSN